MNYIMFARCGALLAFTITLGMSISDGFRTDTLFFYPALILCAFLLVAAFSPKRYAPALLLASFSYATSMYVAEIILALGEGRNPWPLLFGIVSGWLAMIATVHYVTKHSGYKA